MILDGDNGVGAAAAVFEAELGGASHKPGGRASAGASDGPVEDVFNTDGFEGDAEDWEAGNDEEENEGDEKLPSGDVEEGDEGEEGPDDADDSDEDEDGDEEPDEDDDEESDRAEALDRDQEVVVKVDGKEQKVKLGEAISGYIRAETFQNRLSQVNEAKEILLREASNVQASREQYIAGIDHLRKQIEIVLPKKPTAAEWDALFASDPVAAREQQRAWENYDATMQKLDEDRQRAVVESQKEQTRQFTNWVLGEKAKIARLFPQWSDEKTKDRELKSMRRTAEAQGYTKEEIDTLYDSRAISVLWKAAAYDRMVASKKKLKANKTVVSQPASPGSGRSRNGETVRGGTSRVLQELSRTGSVDSAAKFFEGELLRSDRNNRRRRK